MAEQQLVSQKTIPKPQIAKKHFIFMGDQKREPPNFLFHTDIQSTEVFTIKDRPGQRVAHAIQTRVPHNECVVPVNFSAFTVTVASGRGGGGGRGWERGKGISDPRLMEPIQVGRSV